MPHVKGRAPQQQAKEGPMPQLVKKRRSGWAVLAAGALVASLFAVGTNPAAAAEIKVGDANTADPSHPTNQTACLGAASTDREFPDVSEGHAFRSAINCLAHYGITIGYDDGTFQPNVDVPRYQMVLFMERAAALVGAKPSDVVGTFGSDGDREDLVRRDDMALLIANLLVSDPSNNVRRNSSGLITIANSASGTFDYFADARAGSPRHKDEAISALYELGVVQGTGEAKYSPAGSVNRGAMAAFITRALAHTNARPSGVTVQLDDTGAPIVSIRTDKFAPVANASVDVFWREASRTNDVLKADGTCTRLPIAVPSGTPCLLEASDRRTDGQGNVKLPGTVDTSNGAAIWAWTGTIGSSFDIDDANYVRLDVAAKPVTITATSTSVTSDRAAGITLARFGEEVTFTVQLKGTSAGKTVNAGPQQGGDSFRLLVSNPDGTANASTLKMDATGMATFSLTWADGNALTDDSAASVSYTLSPLANARGLMPPDCDSTDQTDAASKNLAANRTHCTDNPNKPGSDTRDKDTDDTADTANNLAAYPDSFSGTIMFDDDAGAATAITVDTGAGYASTPSSGSATNTVTVTVTDQYGTGLGNVPVLLSQPSTVDARATFDTLPYTTNSSGETAISYTYTSGGANQQAFKASVAVLNTSTNTFGPGTVAADVNFYWVSEPALTNGVSTIGTAVNVVAGDVSANTIVANASSPTVVVFDSNDQFTATTASGTVYGMEAFAQALATDMDLTAGAAGNATILWSNYNPNDPASVTQWTLNVS